MKYRLDKATLFAYNFDLLNICKNVLLAQLVEHVTFNDVADGSSPSQDTILRNFGRLAQLVERYPYKVDVTSSSLVMPTIQPKLKNISGGSSVG